MKCYPNCLMIQIQKMTVAVTIFVSSSVENHASVNDPDKNKNFYKEPFVSDLELMMMRKKEDNLSKRHHNDIKIINNNDDIIKGLIVDMKLAAECDRELFKKGKPAISKLTMLPICLSQLKKSNFISAFIEQNVLNVFTNWLAPIPAKSLPSLKVRKFLLKLLSEYPSIEKSTLTNSGIVKALMYLCQHPENTKEN